MCTMQNYIILQQFHQIYKSSERGRQAALTQMPPAPPTPGRTELARQPPMADRVTHTPPVNGNEQEQHCLRPPSFRELHWFAKANILFQGLEGLASGIIRELRPHKLVPCTRALGAGFQAAFLCEIGWNHDCPVWIKKHLSLLFYRHSVPWVLFFQPVLQVSRFPPRAVVTWVQFPVRMTPVWTTTSREYNLGSYFCRLCDTAGVRNSTAHTCKLHQYEKSGVQLARILIDHS